MDIISSIAMGIALMVVMGLVLFIAVIISSGPGDLKFMSSQREERGTDGERAEECEQKKQSIFWRQGDPHQPLNERYVYGYVDANARIEPSLRPPGTVVSWQCLPGGNAKGSLTQGPLQIECSFTKGEGNQCWIDYSSTPDVARAKTVLGGKDITELPGPWWVAIREQVESFLGGVYAEWERQNNQYRMDQLEREQHERQERVSAEERRMLDVMTPHINALRDLNAQGGKE